MRKSLTRFEGEQGMMPGAGAVVDALAAVAAEGAQPAELQPLAGRRHDDEEGRGRERDEGLARQRMALHQAKAQRQGHGLGTAEADLGPPAGGRDLDRRQIVEALGAAGIDRMMRPALALDDIAEGGESLPASAG